jgi:hypothetical protein
MHQRPSRCWICANVRRRHLGSSEPAAEEDGQDGAIAQPLHRRDIRRAEERLSLSQREPIPDPDTHRFRALYASDAGRQFWCEQPIVGRLDREFANG